MRRTHSSESVAASRNPRARSIAVNPRGDGVGDREARREARSCSQLAPEGAVLEGGEERVELGQRGAVRGFQLLDGGDAAGEVALKGEGRNRNGQALEVCARFNADS